MLTNSQQKKKSLTVRPGPSGLLNNIPIQRKRQKQMTQTEINIQRGTVFHLIKRKYMDRAQERNSAQGDSGQGTSRTTTLRFEGMICVDDGGENRDSD